jgi:hypothetical protein
MILGLTSLGDFGIRICKDLLGVLRDIPRGQTHRIGRVFVKVDMSFLFVSWVSVVIQVLERWRTEWFS